MQLPNELKQAIDNNAFCSIATKINEKEIVLPVGECHGDLTFSNMLYNTHTKLSQHMQNTFLFLNNTIFVYFYIWSAYTYLCIHLLIRFK